jgi:hypothetical protein
MVLPPVASLQNVADQSTYYIIYLKKNYGWHWLPTQTGWEGGYGTQAPSLNTLLLQATSLSSDFDGVNFSVTTETVCFSFWVSPEQYEGDLTAK